MPHVTYNNVERCPTARRGLHTRTRSTSSRHTSSTRCHSPPPPSPPRPSSQPAAQLEDILAHAARHHHHLAGELARVELLLQARVADVARVAVEGEHAVELGGRVGRHVPRGAAERLAKRLRPPPVGRRRVLAPQLGRRIGRVRRRVRDGAQHQPWPRGREAFWRARAAGGRERAGGGTVQATC
eukprot:scaffold762_cov121-Isochrysis_galbana.AAC.2